MKRIASSNEITGAKAGGPRQLPIRTRWAAPVALALITNLAASSAQLSAPLSPPNTSAHPPHHGRRQRTSGPSGILVHSPPQAAILKTPKAVSDISPG